MDKCSTQTNISIDESFPTFWSQINCNGIPMTLESGIYNNLNNQPLRGQDIIGFWVPANYTVYAYTGENLSGTKIKYNGGKTYSDLSSPNIGIGRGQIRSLDIKLDQDWNEFRSSCCLSDSTKYMSGECGIWWGSTNTTGECDTLVINHCKLQPWDEKCKCIQSTAGKIAPCVDNQCSGSGAYTTKIQKDIIAKGCPNEITCNQIINYGDNVADNIIKVKMMQICGVQDSKPSGTTSGSPIDAPSGTNPTNTDDINININKKINGGQVDTPEEGLLPFSEENKIYLKNTLGENYELIIVCFIILVIFIAINFNQSSKSTQQPLNPYQPYPIYRQY